MKNLGQVTSPYDAATKAYVDSISGVTAVNTETGIVTMTTEKTKSVPKWNAATTYAANAWCSHNGELWHNTSGAASTGVEPGTDYNVWNVTYSNENLLDNWDFKSPINQRGWVSDKGSTATSYTIDRWRVSNVNTTVTVSKEDGTLTNSADEGATPYLLQIFADAVKTDLLGKYVTLSFMLGNGEIVSKTSLLPTVVPSEVASYCYIPEVGHLLYLSQKLYCRLSGPTGGSSSFKSVKLELGSISTLANDTIPDYGTEFVKCVTSTADTVDAYANRRLLTSANLHTVTIAGTYFDTNYGYVTIDGTKYTAAGEHSVIVGEKVNITVSSSSSTYRSQCRVTLNGTTVQSGAGTYEYEVTGDCTITLTRNGSTYSRYWTAEIVTN